MTAPPTFEPRRMKDEGDCWAACLEMLLDKPYSEVVAAGPKRGRPAEEGLTTRQIINVAKRLGATLKYTKTEEPPYTGIGILALEPKPGFEGDEHVTLYANGMVYEVTNGLMYTDLGAYCDARGFRVVGFFWRES